MRLNWKFAIYNALIKVVIIGAFGLVLPKIVERIVYDHIDRQLKARTDLIMHKISAGYLDEIQQEDCSFDDYTVLKEQFISIKPLPVTHKVDSNQIPEFKNEKWTIGDEAMNQRVIRKEFVYGNEPYELNIGEGLGTIEQLDTTFKKATIWLIIIIVSITMLFDIGFVQILLRPFKKIVSKLRSIDDPLAYAALPIKTSTNEFKYLDETFDELMHRIKLHFTNERDFIANVSHELQTPISILQSRFENIISEGKTNDETAIKIVESQRTLSRLSKVIKALLLISKVENDQYVHDENTNLFELIQEVIDDLDERFEYKNITVTNHVDHSFNIKNSNRSLLYTMFFNLINNAIKYNNDGGFIKIRSTKKSNNQIIEIEDSGKGIESANIDKIFDRFKRFHENDGTSFGLGLPIVKTIANFHHIKIDVQSKLSNGTTFTLTFV